MAPQLPDYGDLVRQAVGTYWNTRRGQAAKSRSQGVLNTGTRAEVTGGKHLDELQALLVRVFIDAGIPPSFQAFAAAVHGRCLQFIATNPDIDWS
jgi:hypothetical protein